MDVKRKNQIGPRTKNGRIMIIRNVLRIIRN